MGSCCKRLVEQWRKERAEVQLLNEGKWVEVFGSSSNRCLKDWLAFSAFRLVLAFIITAILCFDVHGDARMGVADCYLVYLSRWVLLSQVLYFWLAFGTAWRVGLMASGVVPKAERMPLYVKATWVVQDITLPAAVLASSLFWTCVVPFKQSHIDTRSYFTHGVDAVLVILDMAVSRQPYYLRHAANVGIVLVVYVLFTLSYYAAGGTDCRGHRSIYKLLDWGHPWTTALLVGPVVVGAPSLNFLFWFMISQCFPRTYQDDIPA